MEIGKLRLIYPEGVVPKRRRTDYIVSILENGFVKKSTYVQFFECGTDAGNIVKKSLYCLYLSQKRRM